MTKSAIEYLERVERSVRKMIIKKIAQLYQIVIVVESAPIKNGGIAKSNQLTKKWSTG